MSETLEVAAAEPAATDWQRLDPRMLAVTPLRQLFGFLPVIVRVSWLGSGGPGSRPPAGTRRRRR